MKRRRINLYIFTIGICSLGFFLMAVYFISINMRIRTQGSLCKAPIVELYGRISRPNGSCSVLINGEVLDAGSLDEKKSIGDSILVRYIQGENDVVQERVNPKRYYFYYALSGLLLILGLVSIVGSFKGKKLREYRSFTNEEAKQWIIHEIRKLTGKK